MANRRAIEQKIEQLKQMATLGLAETERLLGEDPQHKWSIPDRKIALKFLIAIKGGMEQRQYAALHPKEWARLLEIAPLKRPDSQRPDRVPPSFSVSRSSRR